VSRRSASLLLGLWIGKLSVVGSGSSGSAGRRPSTWARLEAGALYSWNLVDVPKTVMIYDLA